MKKLLVLTFALALGACATFKNPATLSGVYNTDATIGAIAAALNTYRGLCIQKATFVYPTCRTIHPKLAASLLIVRGQVKQAKAFVEANPGDTVTLGTLVSQATASLNQLKADVKANLPATLTVGIQ